MNEIPGIPTPLDNETKVIRKALAQGHGVSLFAAHQIYQEGSHYVVEGDGFGISDLEHHSIYSDVDEAIGQFIEFRMFHKLGRDHELTNFVKYRELMINGPYSIEGTVLTDYSENIAKVFHLHVGYLLWTGFFVIRPLESGEIAVNKYTHDHEDEALFDRLIDALQCFVNQIDTHIETNDARYNPFSL